MIALTGVPLACFAFTGCGAKADVPQTSPNEVVAVQTTAAQLGTTTTLSEATGNDSDVDAGGPAAASALARQARFLDETLPVWTRSPNVLWMDFRSASDLVDASQVVFVGSLVGVEQGVETLDSTDSEDPNADPPVEYDGLVFVATEILKGPVSPGDKIVVAVPSVAASVEDPSSLERVDSDYVELLRPMLNRSPQSHRFVVAANYVDGWTALEFTSPAGVAEFDLDGRPLTIWPRSPLAAAPTDLPDLIDSIKAQRP